MASEDITELLQKSSQHYTLAFHLLTVTYPLLMDPKILLGVLENIHSSLEFAVAALVLPEYHLHQIPLPGRVIKNIDILQMLISKKYPFAKDVASFFRSVHELQELHKRSPMEFRRGQRFVICSKEYDLAYLSAPDLREWLDHTKWFLQDIQKAIERK